MDLNLANWLSKVEIISCQLFIVSSGRGRSFDCSSCPLMVECEKELLLFSNSLI